MMRDAISGVSASSYMSACTAILPSYPRRAGAKPQSGTSSTINRPLRSRLVQSSQGDAWILSLVSSASRGTACAHAVIYTARPTPLRRRLQPGPALGVTGQAGQCIPTMQKTSRRTSGSVICHGIDSTKSTHRSSPISEIPRTPTTSTRRNPYPTGRSHSRRAARAHKVWTKITPSPRGPLQDLRRYSMRRQRRRRPLPARRPRGPRRRAGTTAP